MKVGIIVMGVSGSGKSTIGEALAKALQWRFSDADDFHPESNRLKMASGIPLNDEDRKPWLLTLAQHLADEAPVVLACSALKQSYRDLLGSHGVMLDWIYLQGQPELIAERMNARQGHFMPSALLKSQLETLEPPADAIRLSIELSPDEIVEQAILELRERGKIQI